MSQRLKGDEDLVAQLHMFRTLPTGNSHYIHSFMGNCGFLTEYPIKKCFDKLGEVEVAIKKDRMDRMYPLCVMCFLKKSFASSGRSGAATRGARTSL